MLARFGSALYLLLSFFSWFLYLDLHPLFYPSILLPLLFTTNQSTSRLKGPHKLTPLPQNPTNRRTAQRPRKRNCMQRLRGARASRCRSWDGGYYCGCSWSWGLSADDCRRGPCGKLLLDIESGRFGKCLFYLILHEECKRSHHTYSTLHLYQALTNQPTPKTTGPPKDPYN